MVEGNHRVHNHIYFYKNKLLFIFRKNIFYGKLLFTKNNEFKNNLVLYVAKRVNHICVVESASAHTYPDAHIRIQREIKRKRDRNTQSERELKRKKHHLF